MDLFELEEINLDLPDFDFYIPSYNVLDLIESNKNVFVKRPKKKHNDGVFKCNISGKHDCNEEVRHIFPVRRDTTNRQLLACDKHKIPYMSRLGEHTCRHYTKHNKPCKNNAVYYNAKSKNPKLKYCNTHAPRYARIKGKIYVKLPTLSITEIRKRLQTGESYIT